MSESIAVQAQMSTLRIIVGAMIAGVVLLAIVMLIVVQMPPDEDLRLPLLTALGASFVVSFIVYVVVGKSILSAVSRDVAERAPEPVLPETLLPRFTILIIIRTAAFEGVALLGVIAAAMTGEMAALIVPGVSLVFMVAQFPSRSAWDHFCSRAGIACTF